MSDEVEREAKWLSFADSFDRSQNAAHRRGKDAYKSFAKLVPGVTSRREVLATGPWRGDLLAYLREVHTPAA